MQDPAAAEAPPPLRIGCVQYRNAWPLIEGWSGPVEFDHPAALCRRLAAGELNVALVSSFEYLRNPIYRIADGIAIASDGPVYSVIVAHGGDLTSLEEISLDPASQTSVALLRYLLKQRGLAPRLVAGAASAVGLTAASPSAAHVRGQLLIGDQALRFRRYHPELTVWDLGEAWQQVTGLPFVYALWLIRPEVNEPREIATRLRQIRSDNLLHLDGMIGDEEEFDHEFLHRYYTRHLRFTFGDREKRGLQAFAGACVKLGFLPKISPALDLV